jgi:hypothetical protein
MRPRVPYRSRQRAGRVGNQQRRTRQQTAKADELVSGRHRHTRRASRRCPFCCSRTAALTATPLPGLHIRSALRALLATRYSLLPTAHCPLAMALHAICDPIMASAKMMDAQIPNWLLSTASRARAVPRSAATATTDCSLLSTSHPVRHRNNHTELPLCGSECHIGRTTAALRPAAPIARLVFWGARSQETREERP